MNKKEYMEFHENCCRKMAEITKAKNADYTGVGDDPFANFDRVESLGICSAVQGFLVRMTDKLCRIASFAAKGTLQVKDESVEDTLLDLANYSILLAGYIRQGKEKQPGVSAIKEAMEKGTGEISWKTDLHKIPQDICTHQGVTAEKNANTAKCQECGKTLSRRWV